MNKRHGPALANQNRVWLNQERVTEVPCGLDIPVDTGLWGSPGVPVEELAWPDWWWGWYVEVQAVTILTATDCKSAFLIALNNSLELFKLISEEMQIKIT